MIGIIARHYVAEVVDIRQSGEPPFEIFTRIVMGTSDAKATDLCHDAYRNQSTTHRSATTMILFNGSNLK